MRTTVIGGGVIGLAVAWRAAEQGHDVTLVDPAPGAGASHVAAGMLAPVTEVHYGEEALLALNLESSRRYPSFVAELEERSGVATGYRPCGTLAVARDLDDLEALEQIAAYQAELGLQVQRLRGRQCRELEPGLAPGVRGGVLVAGDHQVDPRRLVAALQSAGRRAGFVTRATRAQSWAPGQVVTDDGQRIESDAVVLAAGAWSSRLEGLPPLLDDLVRPVKGQILRLHAPAPVASRNLRGIDAYLVPRADGELVVGATVEERGFDPTVTAGAAHDLLRAAVELVPELRELALISIDAGFRPGTPDNAPLIGAVEGGLVVATGHYRNGVLLAPVTADAVVELLTTGDSPAVARPFSPMRFVEARR